MSSIKIKEKTGEQVLYRKLMEQVVCPQSMVDGLQEKMVQQAENLQEKSAVGSSKRTADNVGRADGRKDRHWNYKVATAYAAVMAGIVFMSQPQVIHAIENFIAAGVRFVTRTINGVEDVDDILFEYELWAQEVEEIPHDMSEWEEYYPEFYRELNANDMLDVYLPHYKMDSYHLDGASSNWVMVDENGKVVKSSETDKERVMVMGEFRKNSSEFDIYIGKNPGEFASGLISKMEMPYQLEVNGIIYDVFEISDEYTYEEYCAVDDELTGGGRYRMNRGNFNQWKEKPIYIQAMVNDWKYLFRLTEDIDPEEFLETIY